jgi:transposase-like protein
LNVLWTPDVIRHAVWLYLRFILSYRDVEDLLAERGLEISNDQSPILKQFVELAVDIARKDKNSLMGRLPA